MVRRLVQKQDIRLGQQDLRQLYAHIPPLAERLGLSPEILILKAKA